MKNFIEIKKTLASNWFKFLQEKIVEEFELLEKKYNKKKFAKREWSKDNKKEGGGISYLLEGGGLFDKVGVNRSTVSGIFKKEFRSKILGAERDGKYWASGISVVAHMKNPKIPAVHFNTRFIVTSKEWFGGGMDATPTFHDEKEKKKYSQKIKRCLS